MVDLERRTMMKAMGALTLAAGFAPMRSTLAADAALTLAFIPQENPEKLLGDIDVITGYLGERLGVPVEGFVTLDHAAAVEALRGGTADISFTGALPYVFAHDAFGAEVLLAEVYRGSSTYTSRLFVRKDSGLATLEDLRGKTAAFADPISESGYLYPLEILAEAGLLDPSADPHSFFADVYFAGGYQQAIQAVAHGLVDVAGVSEFSDMLLTPEQQTEVHWIAESRPIPSHAVIVRPGLDADLKAAFVEAMLDLNQPENRHLLKHVYGPDGYVATDHQAYEAVSKIARRYGLLG
ncbi:MAG: phosphate/phosphite/phosphonate ABC transporter substrate-binding protein [Alphaproteobacteria bacterium]|nr:phosphate/phosphite/phosphonate ABC transporter substrate-binding protein [Alphaproteobacteria bacterium]